MYIMYTLRLQLIAGTNFSVFAQLLSYTNFSDLCLHNVIKISVCTIFIAAQLLVRIYFSGFADPR